MMKRIRDTSGKLIRIAGLLLLMLRTAPAQNPQPSESQVKSVFIFNFIQFVGWPENVFASAQQPFVIGVIGHDPLGRFLDEAVTGENYVGHPITVKRYKSINEIGNCHILFVGSDDRKSVTEVIRKMKGKNVLLVGDGNNFLKYGGMINLATKGDKITVQINPERTKAAGLSLSSKLMKIAEIVSTDN